MPDIALFASQVGPLLTNFTEPTPQSNLAGFFHNYPRWHHSNDFEVSRSYYASIGVLALPYVLFGLIFIIAILVANAVFRKRHSHRESGSSMGKLGLLGSSTIYLVAFACLGIGIVASDTFRNYGRAINQIFRSFIDEFGVAGLGILELVIKLRKDLLDGNLKTITNQALQSLDPHMETAEQLKVGVEQSIQDARNVIAGADKAISVVYGILIAVFFLLFLGLLLLFSTGVRGTFKRRLALAVYLVPLLLAWVMVGIATSTGAVLGDLCFTVADYQKAVLIDKGVLTASALENTDISKNPMARSKLQCPENLVEESALDALSKTIDVVDKSLKAAANVNPPTPQQLTRVFDISQQGIVRQPSPPSPPSIPSSQQQDETTSGIKELSGAISWVNQKMDTFVACDNLAQLLARLNIYLCGSRQTIMVVFAIWVSLFLLAILLSIMLILASFTRFNPALFIAPRWVATKRGTYLTASKKFFASPSEFSPYFNASAPAPASFMTVDKTGTGETQFVSKI